MNKSKIKFVFIDEFLFSLKSREPKGKTEKESKAHVIKSFNYFHMSFIATFSSKNFYWVIANSDAND